MDLLHLLETTQENIFLTGVAGSGKSSTLRQLVRKAGKSVIVCAPTGVAAINARGQTIHSLFRIPPRMLNDDDIKEIAKKKGYLKHANVV